MRYAMLLRPASTFTLPKGLAWDYVEAPPDVAARRGLPVCRDYPHGIIECRELTAEEVERFDLKRCEDDPECRSAWGLQ